MYIIASLMATFIYVVCMELSDNWHSYKSYKLPKEVSQSNSKVWLSPKIYHNFLKHPHLVIAGHTGYGKTNLIKVVIEQVRGEILLIDLKGGYDYDLVSCTDIESARDELNRIVDEMKKPRREHIYVVIDEAHELLVPAFMTKKEGKAYLECQEAVSKIARLGRSFKIHLIYCTQYPTADVFPGYIKQNCESRAVFRLPTEVASRVALDETGAEELPAGIPGRAIYKNDLTVECQTYEFEKGRGTHAQIRAKKKKRVSDTIEIG